jgi:hypothetical protein
MAGEALYRPVIAVDSGTPRVWSARGGVIDSTSSSAARRARELEHEFQTRATAWRSATAHLSSVADKAADPNYHRIIAMGRDALRPIFKDMQREPDHWFWALRIITGADPVSSGIRGDMQAMTDAWLGWAEEEGLLETDVTYQDLPQAATG